MKNIKIILLVFTILTMHQCNAQNKIPNLTIHPEYKEVEIDSLFEKLDISQLIPFQTDPNGDIHIEKNITLQNGTKVNSRGLQNRYYSQEIIPINGWFTLYKEYYYNRNIEYKRISIKSGSGNFGKLYEFDKDGKLIESIDYDKDYKTSFESITKIADKYAKKYNYKVETAINGKIVDNLSLENNKDNIEISRKEKDEKRFWYIILSRINPRDQTGGKNIERYKITVDDSSGKIIEKKHYYTPFSTGPLIVE